MTPFICGECHEPIMERYLMKVLDKSWHVQCVKCSDCQCLLSDKCIAREGKLYCRKDFFKRYGTKCAGCCVGLCPEDLVRRAINKVYHVQCFLCSMCRKQLNTGEQLYLVQGERFLCERCYQVTTQSLAAAAAQSTSAAVTTPKQETSKYVTTAHTAPSPAPVIPSPVGAATLGSSGGGGDNKRTKPRTSINPQQLELLMQVYSKEQRPSKPLREELMAKTGLDMKVIQVWFQNRRSKEKRDASYREAIREDPSSHHPPPSATPPQQQLLPATTSSLSLPPSAPSPVSTATTASAANGQGEAVL